VSCWEIAWLYKRGRLNLTLPLNIWIDQALQGSGINLIGVLHFVQLR